MPRERSKTYKPKTKDAQSADGMKQHTKPEQIDVQCTDDQVINKITRSKSLYEPIRTGISMHPLIDIHPFPFFIRKHDPERYDIDENTLHKRDDVDVPIQAGAFR
jgi:hypothetical protein